MFVIWNKSLGWQNMYTVSFYRDLVAVMALAFSGYAFLLVT